MICPNCGSSVDDNASVCPNCGKAVNGGSFFNADGSVGPVVKGKNKVAAALFALFLGAVGGQHFYLENTLYGVLSVLFCWTCIPAIIGIIQAVFIFTESNEAFAKRIAVNK